MASPHFGQPEIATSPPLLERTFRSDGSTFEPCQLRDAARSLAKSSPDVARPFSSLASAGRPENRTRRRPANALASRSSKQIQRLAGRTIRRMLWHASCKTSCKRSRIDREAKSKHHGEAYQ